MEEWYAQISDEIIGPLNMDEIVEMINRKEITPNTLLFCKNVTLDWTGAARIKKLANLFDSKPIHFPSKKNPVLAAILSFLVSGLGQFYNEEIPKGVIFLLVGVLGGLVTLGSGYVLIMIWSVIDAYITAERLNQKNVQLNATSTKQREILNKIAPAVIGERELWDEERIKTKLQGLCKLRAQSIVDENEFNSEMVKILKKMIEWGTSGDKYSALNYFNNLKKVNLLREQDLYELKMKLLK